MAVISPSSPARATISGSSFGLPQFEMSTDGARLEPVGRDQVADERRVGAEVLHRLLGAEAELVAERALVAVELATQVAQLVLHPFGDALIRHGAASNQSAVS